MELKQVQAGLRRLAVQQDRLTDAYREGAMELPHYNAEMDRVRAKRSELERTEGEIERKRKAGEDARNALADLEAFCTEVASGLDDLTFEERQRFLRLVVERIVIEDGDIRIDTLIPRQDASGAADGIGELRTRHPSGAAGRREDERARAVSFPLPEIRDAH